MKNRKRMAGVILAVLILGLVAYRGWRSRPTTKQLQDTLVYWYIKIVCEQ